MHSAESRCGTGGGNLAARFAQQQERQNERDDHARITHPHGKIVRPDDVITDGPYKETGEFVTGYMVVRTATIDEAIELAKTNPILRGGGNIEVRAVM